jgi:hypothetical protein
MINAAQGDESLSVSAMRTRAVVVFIGFLSMLATSCVALLMHRNKSLLAHPNKLIFYMCIAEAIAAWQAIIAHVGVGTTICYFALDELLVSSTF